MAKKTPANLRNELTDLRKKYRTLKDHVGSGVLDENEQLKVEVESLKAKGRSQASRQSASTRKIKGLEVDLQQALIDASEVAVETMAQSTKFHKMEMRDQQKIHAEALARKNDEVARLEAEVAELAGARAEPRKLRVRLQTLRAESAATIRNIKAAYKRDTGNVLMMSAGKPVKAEA